MIVDTKEIIDTYRKNTSSIHVKSYIAKETNGAPVIIKYINARLRLILHNISINYL
jgi:hypothetical protein